MIPLGTTDFRSQQKRFYIHTADLARHLYVCGASGSGKSTLLLAMMAAHAERGEGFGLIDPHGELAAQVLDRIPRVRINQTIAFDPSDDWSISLNVLASGDPQFKDLLEAVWKQSLYKRRP
jgi:DNA helicase HerA-like ATPase